MVWLSVWKQVCVKPPMSAVNMMLPTFAAECRAAGWAPLLLRTGTCYCLISSARVALSSKPTGGL